MTQGHREKPDLQFSALIQELPQVSSMETDLFATTLTDPKLLCGCLATLHTPELSRFRQTGLPYYLLTIYLFLTSYFFAFSTLLNQIRFPELG